jgi:hypothetical protein
VTAISVPETPNPLTTLNKTLDPFVTNPYLSHTQHPYSLFPIVHIFSACLIAALTSHIASAGKSSSFLKVTILWYRPSTQNRKQGAALGYLLKYKRPKKYVNIVRICRLYAPYRTLTEREMQTDSTKTDSTTELD